MNPQENLAAALDAAHKADAAVSEARKARLLARSGGDADYLASVRAYHKAKDDADEAWRAADRAADAVVLAGMPDPRQQEPS